MIFKFVDKVFATSQRINKILFIEDEIWKELGEIGPTNMTVQEKIRQIIVKFLSENREEK